VTDNDRHTDPRAVLNGLFRAALRAADPATTLPAALPTAPKGRTLVVGAGKAAGSMARALERHWPGELGGLVVTRYGHGVPCERIDVVEASHPVPDEAGRAAAQRLLDSVRGLTPDDLVLCLMSGGASALLALPAPGLTLADKQAVTRALLKSGATITEINCVRKHLSAIKGGRLAAAAAPARVVTLAISDVPGDDPAVIGSGPTVPDPTDFAEARAILAKHRIAPPPAVAAHLEAAADETPKPGDPRLARDGFILIATPQRSLEAAADAARAAGITPIVLSDAIEGEARDVALVHAAIARQLASGRFVVGDRAVAPPAVLLSGGETSVTVRGRGRGGRNAEFLLALAIALDGHSGIFAIACDTDGIDGTEENAGAVCGPDTIARAAARGIDLKARLADNDAWSVFDALGDLVVTGPTLTNVNDFRAILVLDGARRPDESTSGARRPDESTSGARRPGESTSGARRPGESTSGARRSGESTSGTRRSG
jgi:hydroxypyruvate reductase